MKKISKEPFISVVIATYNSRRTIEKCLQAIKKQTFMEYEIIVVDSPFYDKKEQKICKKIIEKYAQYFQDGPERSIQRNRGIKEAKGKYILILDQDMYMSPTVLEETYKTMEKGKYIALNIPEISIGEGFWTQCVALERYVSTYLESALNECCRFFKKSDAERIGSYDPEMVGVEDSDFHYRMAQHGKIGKIKSVIHHDEGKTDFFGRIRKKYYYSKAFKKYVQKYPNIAVAQFSPLKGSYLKHWKLFAKQPHVTGGIVLLRGGEVIAGAAGMITH